MKTLLWFTALAVLFAVSCEEEPVKAEQPVLAEAPAEPQPAPVKVCKCVALSGAVILEDSGKSRVKYKRRCEACGSVRPGTVSTAVSHTLSTSFRCPECRRRQKVILKRN